MSTNPESVKSSGEQSNDVKLTDKEAKTLFVVENGLNTCYIDSLLMALFYKSTTYLDNLLITEPKDPNCIYLQEIIKIKFVDSVRKTVSVMSDVMNEIRIVANIMGWMADQPAELFEQQDVNEFYTFILDKWNSPLIEIQRQTISEALDNKNDVGAIEKIPFISLHVTDDKSDTSVKDLLLNWMNNNPIDIKREIVGTDGNKKLETVKALNLYKIMNVPTFIGISLNRFNQNIDRRLETKVDIQKKIKLHHISDDHDGLRWRIHSVICHRGDTPKSGHYYSILFLSDNTWALFDDLAVPCLKDINMKDPVVSDTIKREVVFAIYCYDEAS